MGKDKVDIIVIGTGMGGLSASAMLAGAGLKVKVFERLSHSGGLVGTFTRKGYCFEASTHQVGAGFDDDMYLKPAMNLLKLDVPFIPLNHCFEAIRFQPDSFRFFVEPGVEPFITALRRQFPGVAESDLDVIRTIFHITGDTLKMRQAKRMKKPVDMEDFPYFAEYRDKTFSFLLDKVREPEIRFLLSQYCFFYIQYYPSGTPAVFMSNLISNLLLKPPLFIKGGTKVLVDKCVDRIQAEGGTIHYRCGVKEVLTEKGKAVGVVLENGERHYSDYIIANVNALTLYRDMIADKSLYSDIFKEKIASYKPSRSVFQVYLGVPFLLEDYGYKGSTMFFSGSDDMEKMYSLCGDKEKNGFLITSYTAMDRDFSPPGKSSIVICEYRTDSAVWSGLNEKEYAEAKEKATSELIRKARDITGLPLDKAEVVFASTPRTMTLYSGSIDGAIFGSEIVNYGEDGPLENLILAGADATIAGSVVSCFVSGISAASKVKELIQKRG